MVKEIAQAEESKKINRREFLNFAWLASLGFLTLNVAGLTYLFSLPRFKAGEFGGVFPVGDPSVLPAVGSGPMNIPKVKLWVSNTDEGVTALYKVCTHLGCLYNWRESESKFVCPCHGSQFHVDGTYIQGPAPRNLDRFVVQLVDPDTGEVVAQTDAEGSPLPLPEGSNLLIQVDTGKRIKGKNHA